MVKAKFGSLKKLIRSVAFRTVVGFLALLVAMGVLAIAVMLLEEIK